MPQPARLPPPAPGPALLLLAVLLAAAPVALAQQCDVVCDCATPCSTRCDDLELDGVDCGWYGVCEDSCGVTACSDLCTPTTACNRSCRQGGQQTTCSDTPYPCTEKNAGRTHLFRFTLGTLNTWLLDTPPPFEEGRDRTCRATEIGRDLRLPPASIWSYDWDVALLQEGFTDEIFDLTSAAGCGTRYEDCVVKQPGSGPFQLNGGLAILTRLPWTYLRDEAWEDCSGTFGGGNDCLANKGFLHARLRHASMSAPLEVINVHLDAGAGDSLARRGQLQQLRGELNRYPHGTFLIAGDFNIVGPPCVGDACADVSEYGTIRNVLGPAFTDAWAADPTPGPAGAAPPGGTQCDCVCDCDTPASTQCDDLELDAVNCQWFGVHEDAAICTDGDPSNDPLPSCGIDPIVYGFTADDVSNTQRDGSRRERIDYVWFDDSRNCYELELVETEVHHFPDADDACPRGHLSDHYGVVATFDVWKRAGVGNCADPDPDGGVDASVGEQCEDACHCGVPCSTVCDDLELEDVSCGWYGVCQGSPDCGGMGPE